MGHDEVTRIVLELLRRPRGSQKTQVQLTDGRLLSVRVAGIECFGAIRSLEVVEVDSNVRRLIPYCEIENVFDGSSTSCGQLSSLSSES